MKGDKTVIEHLNRILKNELTAINQYFLHSRILGDWGVSKLSKKAYEESIEEMEHADKLIQRILFLEGLPNLQELNKLRIGENVKEIIECDLAIELDAVPDLREAIAYADSIRDYVSRDLFNEILNDEEEHVDFLETQLDLIGRIGLEHYTHLQSEANAMTEGG
ncbi:MAG: bacterioferritin [Alphaproteobacteria bacterium]|nr:bacterioferritin [Alphaproteobacteria bacterium]